MGLVKDLYSLSDKTISLFTAADALLKALVNVTWTSTKSVIRLSQQNTEICHAVVATITQKAHKSAHT